MKISVCIRNLFLLFIAATVVSADVERTKVIPCHPADKDEDWTIIMGEAISCLSDWQQGAVSMAYAIRAAYLWQNGESYVYDMGQDPPMCWTLPGQTEGEGESPEEILIELPGEVPLVLVRIPGGSFQMGSPETERGRWLNEGPLHEVTINYNFYMGKYEITQQQWIAVMDSWPDVEPSSAYGLGDTYPAYRVSWNDAKDFISTLNTHITATGQGPATVRLPTEAEWEYACRAGTNNRFFFGDSLAVDDECEDDGIRSQYMWYCGNNAPDKESTSGSKPVGETMPNGFGLFDMSGNIYEWCEDEWHDSYAGAPDDGSAWTGPSGGTHCVARGGAWLNYAKSCRSAKRDSYWPSYRNFLVGFRLVIQ